jgi:hypothetical protein
MPPSKAVGTPNLKGRVETGCDIAIALLRTIHASADVFPPLKAVAGGTLYIAETVKVSAHRSEENNHPSNMTRNSNKIRKIGENSANMHVKLSPPWFRTSRRAVFVVIN